MGMGNNNSSSYKYGKENIQTIHKQKLNNIGQKNNRQPNYNKSDLINNQNNTLKNHEMYLKLNKVRKNVYLRNHFEIITNNFINYKKKTFELYKTYFSLWQVHKNKDISNKLYITQLNQLNHATVINESKTQILNIYFFKWRQYCKIYKKS